MKNFSINKIFNINHQNFILFLCTIICIQQIEEAKGVMLVPLTAPKVYKLLMQGNYLDAVPEGRVITQGIAAVTGFNLGLLKAVGGVLLYDIITANITEDTAQPAPTPVYLTQEVCFNSRSARSLDEAEAIAEAYDLLDEKGMRVVHSVRKSEQKRRLKPKRNKKRNFKSKRKSKRPQRIKVVKPNNEKISPVLNPSASGTLINQPSTTAAATAGTNAAVTQTTQPEATNVATNVATGSAGGDLETTSSSTTSTDNENNSVTCIVIQKPKQ